MARRGSAGRITMDVALYVLNTLKYERACRIQPDDETLLKEVFNKSKKRISDHPRMLRNMQMMTVLEFNGERWHDLHPLIGEYLLEEGIVQVEKREDTTP